ncbi:hypothetical protein GE09DRAFT_320435 [Coniochaeta sp. 2T2.1]|nr:hypothetical protein GE09DRAFT_320435 [Coniochaeta sp. 2T2.1]
MHLLLRQVVDDEEEIELMVLDADHKRWASPELSERLKIHLGRSYGSLEDIVEEIGTNMEYLLIELERFEALEDECSRLKDKAHRFGSAAKLTFDKSKCDEAVQSLRTANDDLQRLREQALDLQPTGTKQCSNSDRRSELGPKLRSSYGSCAKIRRASKALYEGLAKTLPSHHHDVRLFLDATVVEDHTVTDLAILCDSRAATSRNIVQVRSRPIEWLDIPPQPFVCAGGEPAVVESPRKRRKVRWLDQQSDTNPAELDPDMEAKPDSREDFRRAQDLCLEICRGTGCHDERSAKDCLCYVETSVDQTFRHEFYARGGQNHRPTELAAFDDIFLHPVKTSISMVDQLKLARTIVSAVLYFSSTPWLAREYWGMKDLCFFLDRNDLSTSLRTLNLGVKFLGTDTAQLESAMEEIDSASSVQDSPAATEEAMMLYGIRNLTLHSLGVVLLQIGRWNKVEADDILQVRRLSSQVPRLGPKYRDLMQKCLNCDFGCGSNLSRPKLQTAVYEGVVEELDAMIRCLDISTDEQAP